MSNDAAGFAFATDRMIASPKRAFDVGLRPSPFPDQAANLLPGLLAATRTGLTPASDDELQTRTSPHSGHLPITERTDCSTKSNRNAQAQSSYSAQPARSARRAAWPDPPHFHRGGIHHPHVVGPPADVRGRQPRSNAFHRASQPPIQLVVARRQAADRGNITANRARAWRSRRAWLVNLNVPASPPGSAVPRR